LNDCINGFEQNERIVVLGDRNARDGDVEVEEVIGKFGVRELKWEGGRIVRFYTAAGLIARNTWLTKKRANKYMWLRDNGSDEALMNRL
jgi:hypothetical protein